MKNNWDTAQKEELSCWVGNQSKLESPVYLEAKKIYWLKMVDLCKKYLSVSNLHQKYILEFGCGPTGTFLIVNKNDNYICLDPLMNSYLDRFDFIKNHQVKFINSKLENFKTNKKFDVILGFNALDHVDNINLVINKLHNLSSGLDAFVIISVNVHKLKIIQVLLNFMYPVLDKLHKHQYTSNQYKDLFRKANFKIIDEICSDNISYEFIKKINSLEINNLKNKSIKLTPSSIFFGLLKKFGWQRHGFENPNKKSLYINKIFILQINDN